MGIQKTFSTKIGVDGNYIKCNEFDSVNVKSKTGLIKIKGYFSEASYNDNSDSLSEFQCPLGVGSKKKDVDGVLTQLDFDSVYGQSEEIIDKFLVDNNFKIEFIAVVDLSDGIVL